jgi:hypothetical protein
MKKRDFMKRVTAWIVAVVMTFAMLPVGLVFAEGYDDDQLYTTNTNGYTNDEYGYADGEDYYASGDGEYADGEYVYTNGDNGYANGEDEYADGEDIYTNGEGDESTNDEDEYVYCDDDYADEDELVCICDPPADADEEDKTYPEYPDNGYPEYPEYGYPEYPGYEYGYGNYPDDNDNDEYAPSDTVDCPVCGCDDDLLPTEPESDCYYDYPYCECSFDGVIAGYFPSFVPTAFVGILPTASVSGRYLYVHSRANNGGGLQILAPASDFQVGDIVTITGAFVTPPSGSTFEQDGRLEIVRIPGWSEITENQNVWVHNGPGTFTLTTDPLVDGSVDVSDWTSLRVNTQSWGANTGDFVPADVTFTVTNITIVRGVNVYWSLADALDNPANTTLASLGVAQTESIVEIRDGTAPATPTEMAARLPGTPGSIDRSGLTPGDIHFDMQDLSVANAQTRFDTPANVRRQVVAYDTTSQLIAFVTNFTGSGANDPNGNDWSPITVLPAGVAGLTEGDVLRVTGRIGFNTGLSWEGGSSGLRRGFDGDNIVDPFSLAGPTFTINHPLSAADITNGLSLGWNAWGAFGPIMSNNDNWAMIISIDDMIIHSPLGEEILYNMATLGAALPAGLEAYLSTVAVQSATYDAVTRNIINVGSFEAGGRRGLNISSALIGEAVFAPGTIIRVTGRTALDWPDANARMDLRVTGGGVIYTEGTSPGPGGLFSIQLEIPAGTTDASTVRLTFDTWGGSDASNSNFYVHNIIIGRNLVPPAVDPTGVVAVTENFRPPATPLIPTAIQVNQFIDDIRDELIAVVDPIALLPGQGIAEVAVALDAVDIANVANPYSIPLPTVTGITAAELIVTAATDATYAGTVTGTITITLATPVIGDAAFSTTRTIPVAVVIPQAPTTTQAELDLAVAVLQPVVDAQTINATTADFQADVDDVLPVGVFPGTTAVAVAERISEAEIGVAGIHRVTVVVTTVETAGVTTGTDVTYTLTRDITIPALSSLPFPDLDDFDNVLFAMSTHGPIVGTADNHAPANFQVGAIGQAGLGTAGDVTVLTCPDSGSRYLSVVGRSDNWNGIDIRLGELPFTMQAGQTLTIVGSVKSTLPAGSTIQVQRNNPYSSLADATIDADGVFTVSHVLVDSDFMVRAGETDPPALFRINTTGAAGSVNFYIYDIIFSGQEPAVLPPPEIEGVVVWTLADNIDNWNNYVQGATRLADGTTRVGDRLRVDPRDDDSWGIGIDFNLPGRSNHWSGIRVGDIVAVTIELAAGPGTAFRAVSYPGHASATSVTSGGTLAGLTPGSARTFYIEVTAAHLGLNAFRIGMADGHRGSIYVLDIRVYRMPADNSLEGVIAGMSPGDIPQPANVVFAGIPYLDATDNIFIGPYVRGSQVVGILIERDDYDQGLEILVNNLPPSGLIVSYVEFTVEGYVVGAPTGTIVMAVCPDTGHEFGRDVVNSPFEILFNVPFTGNSPDYPVVRIQTCAPSATNDLVITSFVRRVAGDAPPPPPPYVPSTGPSHFTPPLPAAPPVTALFRLSDFLGDASITTFDAIPGLYSGGGHSIAIEQRGNARRLAITDRTGPEQGVIISPTIGGIQLQPGDVIRVDARMSGSWPHNFEFGMNMNIDAFLMRGIQQNIGSNRRFILEHVLTEADFGNFTGIGIRTGQWGGAPNATMDFFIYDIIVTRPHPTVDFLRFSMADAIRDVRVGTDANTLAFVNMYNSTGRIVENNGVRSIYVTQGRSDWHTLEFRLTHAANVGVGDTLIITGRTGNLPEAAGGTMNINARVGGWSPIANTNMRNVDEDGFWTVSIDLAELAVNTMRRPTWRAAGFTLHGNAGASFYLYDVRIVGRRATGQPPNMQPLVEEEEVEEVQEGLTELAVPIVPVVAPQPDVLRLAIGSPSFVFNGEARMMNVAPFMLDNRTMVPLRFIAEMMGAEVDFIPETRTVTIDTDEISLRLPVDIPLPDDMGTPIIRYNLTFVPIRFVGEILGATFRWDPVTRAVYIYL